MAKTTTSTTTKKAPAKAAKAAKPAAKTAKPAKEKAVKAAKPKATATKAAAPKAAKSAAKPKAGKTAAKPAAKAPAKKAAKKTGDKGADDVPGEGPAREGEPAPAFTAIDHEGRSVGLRDLLGKSGLVLYFYPKDDTPGCTQEACAFRDRMPEFGAAGWNVYGVSRDRTDAHRKFREKYGLNFPLLTDVDGQITEKFGVWQQKTMMGKTYMGIVRATFLIDSQGVIRKVYPKVSPKDHASEILADIKNL